MKKNVWILNHYAAGQFLKQGGRHYWFAKFLKEEGYEPTVFCCSSTESLNKWFNTKNLWVYNHAKEIDVPFINVKSNIYKGNGKDRILNMIGFYRNVQIAAKEYAKTHKKPDIIYASSVHPLTLVAGIKLAKYFGIKCICEVRDLWPLSLVEYKIIKEDSLIAKALYKGERWIYKNADAIVFTMGGGYDYIIERGWHNEILKSKVYYINNGIDLKQFDYNKEHFFVRDEDLENEDVFKVVYAGSIRRVNNLGKLIDIAKIVKNPNIKFLVWGDGNELPKLKARIENEKVKNVIFKGRVEKKYVPYITSRADLNFAHNSNSSLFRFGISFNKIFDYLASGKLVLCDFYAGYNPILTCGAGISVDSGEVKDIANTIDMLAVYSKEKLIEFGQKARNGAIEYDFSNLTKKLIYIIENI